MDPRRAAARLAAVLAVGFGLSVAATGSAFGSPAAPASSSATPDATASSSAAATLPPNSVTFTTGCATQRVVQGQTVDYVDATITNHTDTAVEASISDSSARLPLGGATVPAHGSATAQGLLLYRPGDTFVLYLDNVDRTYRWSHVVNPSLCTATTAPATTAPTHPSTRTPSSAAAAPVRATSRPAAPGGSLAATGLPDVKLLAVVAAVVFLLGVCAQLPMRWLRRH